MSGEQSEAIKQWIGLPPELPDVWAEQGPPNLAGVSHGFWFRHTIADIEDQALQNNQPTTSVQQAGSGRRANSGVQKRTSRRSRSIAAFHDASHKPRPLAQSSDTSQISASYFNRKTESTSQDNQSYYVTEDSYLSPFAPEPRHEDFRKHHDLQSSKTSRLLGPEDEAWTFHGALFTDEGTNDFLSSAPASKESVRSDSFMRGLTDSGILHADASQYFASAPRGTDHTPGTLIPGPTPSFVVGDQTNEKHTRDDSGNRTRQSPNQALSSKHRDEGEAPLSSSFRYACPFVKHNRKVYGKAQWKGCNGLGWPDVRRVKIIFPQDKTIPSPHPDIVLDEIVDHVQRELPRLMRPQAESLVAQIGAPTAASQTIIDTSTIFCVRVLQSFFQIRNQEVDLPGTEMFSLGDPIAQEQGANTASPSALSAVDAENNLLSAQDFISNNIFSPPDGAKQLDYGLPTEAGEGVRFSDSRF
ncbi:hypothetical protein F66182_1361 [Fusarium sp. NRRL 66182]|nr:hypothetical protein F66182_1361 [Fusarium sp. NRRL 66182]